MNLKRLLLGTLLIGAGAALAHRWFGAAAPAQAPDDRSTFEAVLGYLEQQRRRLKIPGMALTIVAGDRIVYQRGLGHARPGGEVPTPRTPFAVGSTTKSFTALAVMQLVEAGKIELDAPVQRYLPWFRVADLDASAKMTVRHLLNQTSGMSMLAGTICLADRDARPDAGERQARSLATLQLSCPVGTCFQYCNLNYNLLGLIIEAASGQPYAEYVQDNILAPLGMSRTTISRTLAREYGLAMGTRYWFGVPIPAPDLPFPPSALPAGGLISTSDDLARYVIAHLNGGRCGEARILSEAGMDEMHRAVAEQRVMGAPLTAYGMGWFVNQVGSSKLVSHGGNVPEFCSFLGLLPEQRQGFVILANADPWGLPFVMAEIGEGVAALLAGERPAPVRFGHLLWMMRALPLVPLLQLADVGASLGNVGRRIVPGAGRARGHAGCLPVLLPLLANLSPAAIWLYLRSRGLLRYMDLYMPDLSWTIKVSGGLALVWSCLRTLLILRAGRWARIPSMAMRRP